MPFVRVTRDKRGYEQVALMQASARRGKASKPRTLYVFRTPPGVKVGREPFDESIRRTIEELNPGVFFDWKKLSHIVPPPPDVEFWREKRRAEKAARQARRETEREPGEAPAERIEAHAASPETASETTAGAPRAQAAAEGESPETQPATGQPAGHRRRRRPRGGRGRRRPPQVEPAQGQTPGPPKIAEDPSKER